MNKKTFRIFLVFAILILFLFKVVPDLKKDSNCETLKIFISTSFNGVITKKYIDSSQHSYRTLILKDFDFNQDIRMNYFDFDTSDFYNQIKIGDTIYKRMSSDSIFKYINRKKIFFSKIDFGCNEPPD